MSPYHNIIPGNIHTKPANNIVSVLEYVLNPKVYIRTNILSPVKGFKMLFMIIGTHIE
jgi:hypothetical protein